MALRAGYYGTLDAGTVAESYKKVSASNIRSP